MFKLGGGRFSAWRPLASRCARALLRRVWLIGALAWTIGIVGCQSPQTSSASPGTTPSTPIDIKGGGVPIQTSVAFLRGGNRSLYIALDPPHDNQNIDLLGPVEISYADGSRETVYVPSGSWDCVCAERANVNAQSTRSANPNGGYFGDARDVCRAGTGQACPNPRPGAPNCLTSAALPFIPNPSLQANFGGGVPIQTFLQYQSGGKYEVYLKLNSSAGGDIEQGGVVEIWYEPMSGASEAICQVVEVPPGTWDCICEVTVPGVVVAGARSIVPGEEVKRPNKRTPIGAGRKVQTSTGPWPPEHARPCRTHLKTGPLPAFEDG